MNDKRENEAKAVLALSCPAFAAFLAKNPAFTDANLEVHGRVVTMLLHDTMGYADKVSTLIEIWCEYGKGCSGRDSQEYWACIVEALFLLHYQYAGSMMKDFSARLQQHSNLLPSVITGMLKAANWGIDHAEKRNESFATSLPRGLGDMLVIYVVCSDGESHGTSPDLRMLFAAELATYFGYRLTGERDRRVKDFTKAFRKIAPISQAIQPFIEEVSGRLRQMLKLDEFIKGICDELERIAKEREIQVQP